MTKLVALSLGGGKWIVRPEGACGTSGTFPKPWDAFFCNASSRANALRKAAGKVFHPQTIRSNRVVH